MSVSVTRGVVPRSEIADGDPRAADLSNYKVCQPGDIVLNRMSAYQGALGLARQQGLVSPDYAVLAPTERAHGPYLAHLMKSPWFVDQMIRRLRGIGAPGVAAVRTPRVNVSDLASIAVPLPTIEVQRALANELDGLLAKIQDMAAGRREQAELADEYLRAVLDRAYSTADVVEATRRPLRSVVNYFQDGDWIEAPYIVDDGVRLVQTGNVGLGVFRDTGHRYISEQTFHDLNCKDVMPGDVLISRLGSPVGRACRMPDLGVRAISSVDVVICRPVAEVDPDFLVGFLSTPKHLADCEVKARGTTMQRLSRTQVGRIDIPLPGASTQRNAADGIREARTEMTRVKAEIEAALALLDDLRAAEINRIVFRRSSASEMEAS
jgi:type I restriction enzyme S subunit